MKKKIIILSIVILILVVTSLVLFVPKRFTSYVPFKNIESITYTDIRKKEDEKIVSKELSSEEIYEFLDVICKSSFNRRILSIKLGECNYYEIKYKDGTIIKLSNSCFTKINKNGKTSGFQYKLYGKITGILEQ